MAQLAEVGARCHPAFRIDSPVTVSSGHELSTSSLRGKPNALVRNAIRGWNAAVNGVPGWPQQRLTLAEIEPDGYVFPAQSFPSSLQHTSTRSASAHTSRPVAKNSGSAARLYRLVNG